MMKLPRCLIVFVGLVFVQWLAVPTGTTLAQGARELQTAIAGNQLDEVQRQIEGNRKLLTTPVASNLSPLHYAIMSRKQEVVKLLLELGAPLTPSSTKQPMLHAAIACQDAAIVDLILDQTKDIDQRDRSGGTALIIAVKYRNLPLGTLDKLLKRGANVSAVNTRKQSALHMACSYRRVDWGKRLIDAGADITLSDNRGMTPFLAACSSTPELIPVLLAKGADPKTKDAQGRTPLHLICDSYQPGAKKSAKLLLEQYDLVDIEDNSYMTPLWNSVIRGNQELTQLLLDRGANPNYYATSRKQSANARRIEPIMNYPARRGQTAMVKQLLKANARVDAQNQQGNSALHLAAEAGQMMLQNANQRKNAQPFVVMISDLLAAGSDPNLKNSAEETAIEVAAKRGFYDAVEKLVEKSETLEFDLGVASLMHWGAEHGLTKMTKRLLTLDTKSLNLADGLGRTPLYLAAENGHLDVVRLLLENQAKLDSPDEDGTTPLLAAANGGHASVVTALLNAGADVSNVDGSGQSALHLAAWAGAADVVAVLAQKVDVSKLKTSSGNTPLHAAAWKGHADAVNQLLKAGGDPNALDSDGWSPLHKAAFRGHAAVVSSLISSGADKSLKTSIGMTALAMAESSKQTEVVQLLMN
ncbi:MAG: ankyrin repeat protein [Mariniblastus sp.]|jgi:ankyrin repeat protein